MSRSSFHKDSLPIWVIVLGFIFAPPAGVVLLILKLIMDNKAPQRNYVQRSAMRQANFDPQTGKPLNQNSVSNPRNTVQSFSSRPDRPFPHVPLSGGRGFIIAGAVVSFLFGICFMDEFLTFGLLFPEDLFPLLALTCAGIGSMVWGIFKNMRKKKFKRYLARIHHTMKTVPLRTLAESIPASMDEVCGTLQDMIDLGVFGDKCYLDINRELLVLDSTSPEAQQPVKAPEPPKKKAHLSPDDEILLQIRQANDRIPSPVLSAKIDRIEEITRHILAYLKKHPERSSELHTFLDYYLPTTLKMLNTYADLESQGLDVDNVSATKVRIEGILDKIVEGFEAQLDKLFEGDMMDISSDIDVMEQMLRRDGLSNELKASKPSGTSDYSPTLALTPDQDSASAAQAKKDYDQLGSW